MNMIPDQTLLFHHVILLVAAFLLLSSSTLISAQSYYNSTAELSTSWINNHSVGISDPNFGIIPILVRKVDGSVLGFICGFYCNIVHENYNEPYINESFKDCIFGVLISKFTQSARGTFEVFWIESSILVWSANRNNPVQMNATLVLGKDGDLNLTNSDGSLVWSSHTGGKSVAGMNLTESGNLVLFGKNKEPIWESFDYPTDTLLLGQKLTRGQRLTSNVSSSNSSEGLYYLSVHTDYEALAAYIKSDPPHMYYFSGFDVSLPYVEFMNGSFHRYKFSSAARFIKLGLDGHLKVFRWGDLDGWTEVADLLSVDVGACGYPMVCGRYGVCSEGQCNCPPEFFFRQPNLGCSLITPISCDHSKDHTFLELNSTYYFAFHPDNYIEGTLVEDCKIRCLNTCSCKAALYVKMERYGSPPRIGCLLLNEVFSFADKENSMASRYETTLYIKVQNPYSNASGRVQQPYANASGPVEHPIAKGSRRRTITIASSLATLFGVLSVIGSCLIFYRKQNKQWSGAHEVDFLDHVPGMPTRYSYQILKAATQDFSNKLGEGGFGSVYEGVLSDGTKVAVKYIDGLAKVKESFFVEVKAIGSIDHVNLVKLVGFCIEKSHMLLVYEYITTTN